MHNRQDITETNLKPALLEGKDDSAHLVTPETNEGSLTESVRCCHVFRVSAVGTQTAFLEAQVGTFTRHRSRLAVVREQKEKARLDMLGENKSSEDRRYLSQHVFMSTS